MGARPFRGFLALLAAAAPACRGLLDGNDDVLIARVASLTLEPDSVRLVTGDTARFTVTLRDHGGAVLTGRSVVFATSNPAVVTVSGLGVARGVDVGTALVSATADGRADTSVVVVTPVTFGAVTAGGNHSCAVTVQGQAFCWGWNFYSQLGVGFTSFAEATPLRVVGGLRLLLPTGGGNHTCALSATGAAYCWGWNVSGQLGHGPGGDAPLPVRVLTDARLTWLVAGGRHTCGLTPDGQAFCWGLNQDGQVGDGTLTDTSEPIEVATPQRFSAITAGGRHTCGLTADGAAYCWGANETGQLGDGTTIDRLTPVTVTGGHTFALVQAGRFHTCGITSGGAAYCWGANAKSQLGTGAPGDSQPTPQPVAGGKAFVTLAAGGLHNCAVAPDGVAYCWGSNVWGQLGDSSTTDRAVPAAVGGGLRFAQLAAGADHTCGLTTAGVAYCWGYGGSGEIGDGRQDSRPVPVRVAGQPP